MAQTTKANTENPERSSTLPVERVVESILQLSLGAQLGVLRTVAPKIIARLQREERESFIDDLNEEMSRAVHGRPSDDVRPDVPNEG